jgi:hypothetical protein
MVPEALRGPDGRTYVELVGPATVERGEPWRTFLTPGEVGSLLGRHGFVDVVHREQRELFHAHGWRREWLRPSTLSRIVSATVAGR